MAEGGHVPVGVAGSSSSTMYYDPLHAWGIGLADPPVEFTPEEIVVNTINENELRDVLRPIQAYSEFYWIRLPERKAHSSTRVRTSRRETRMSYRR